MPDEEYSLFESVIHITEERDKRSLEKALVETLADFINYDALILLRLPRNSNHDYLEAAVSLPKTATEDKLQLIPHEYGDLHVQLDSSFSLCINKDEIIQEEQNSTGRLLFPITVNNIVTGVLDIYGHQKTKDTERLIRGFIRIYSNFQAIIDDNEHDALTGLLNRKTFDAQLSDFLSSSSAENNDLVTTGENRRTSNNNTSHWIAILDIDHFKRINDNFGHVYGDEVLLLFADLMKKAFRDSDLLFRYGGEEFVVVLTPASDSDAHIIFDRFRQRLEQFEFPQIGQITVSIGMIQISAQEHPITALERADKALYYAKEHGRNQVRSYHQLLKEGHIKEQLIDSDIELF